MTGVALIRPGYSDSDDVRSIGTSYRHEGDGYRDHVIAAVAGAIVQLKAYHEAQRIVLVG